MFSPAKKFDRELLLEIGETILAVVKIKTIQALDLAEQMGQLYTEIETRIATKDYTYDDEQIDKLDKLFIWPPLFHVAQTDSSVKILSTKAI